MKRNRWMAGFTACLLAFTVYLSLDTFVLSSAYQTDATEMNLEMIREAEQKTAQSEEQSTAQGEDQNAGQNEEVTAADEAEQSAAPNEEQNAVPNKEKTTVAAAPETKIVTSDSAGENTDKPSSETGSGEGKPGSSKRRKKGSRPGGTADSGSVGSSDSSGSGSGFGSSGSSGSASGGSASGGGRSGGSHSGGRSSASFDVEDAAEEAAAVTTDNAGEADTYEDENVKITYTQYTTNGTTIHVADVQLSSAEYLKTAFADDTYGKNVKASTSEIAAANDAILAVNGDYYGVQESGYVIRNGIVYRETAGTNEVLCIYADGSMKVVDPSTVTAQELVDQGVWQAFSFGPGLVENGEVAVSLNSEVGKAKASNPRTAIGIIDDLHYVFVVSDGRSGESEGLSLYELATFMDQLGVETAYNLDGGGSSTMVFQGSVVNDPSGGMGGHGDQEREVSDIVYIG